MRGAENAIDKLFIDRRTGLFDSQQIALFGGQMLAASRRGNQLPETLKCWLMRIACRRASMSFDT